MASAFGSFTIGSVVASSLRSNASRMPHTLYQSTTSRTSSSENGLSIRYIYTHHPKRKLHEVRYARHVGMPSGRRPPSAFGM